MNPILWSLIAIVGVIMAHFLRRIPTARRLLIRMGLGASFLLLAAWLVSMRYSFGYVGIRFGVFYESAAMTMFASHGLIQCSEVFFTESRRPIIWVFDCPALFPLTAGWIPLLAIAIPTAILCKPRRFKPGHCEKCAYNLEGLTEPRSPECGTDS